MSMDEIEMGERIKNKTDQNTEGTIELDLQLNICLWFAMTNTLFSLSKLTLKETLVCMGQPRPL